MKHNLASLEAALVTAPAGAVKIRLHRLVPFRDLVAYNPPDWLYTSGKPNRYNAAGVHCVYFGESWEAAQTEYQGMWKGIPGANQPVVTYCAEVSLRRVLDLADPAILKRLKIEKRDLFKNWRRAKKPTLMQSLGQAVCGTGLFSAICYPSAAAASYGRAPVNFVIFHDCVQSPDFVRILGPDSTPLDEWP